MSSNFNDDNCTGGPKPDPKRRSVGEIVGTLEEISSMTAEHSTGLMEEWPKWTRMAKAKV